MNPENIFFINHPCFLDLDLFCLQLYLHERKTMCTIMVDEKHQIMKCICTPPPTLPKTWGVGRGTGKLKQSQEKRKLNLKGKGKHQKGNGGKGGGWERGSVHTLVRGQVPRCDKGHHHCPSVLRL